MLDLPPGQVHHWWAAPTDDLVTDPVMIDRWLSVLDEAERERHAAYRREVDRQRFLVAAVMVRMLGASVLGTSPGRVPVDRRCPRCTRPHGRIRIPGPVEVSVSHAGDWVVVAACRSQPVGVDVGRVDPAVDHLGVGRIAFTDEEAAWLEAQSDELRPGAFATLWTRKEAVVKTTGDGIGVDLRGLAVTLPNRAAGVRSWSGRDDVVPRLHLADIEVDLRHRACLAVMGAPPDAIVRHDGRKLFVADG
jgi:4'-phosphopantetheinyl transferase